MKTKKEDKLNLKDWQEAFSNGLKQGQLKAYKKCLEIIKKPIRGVDNGCANLIGEEIEKEVEKIGNNN